MEKPSVGKLLEKAKNNDSFAEEQLCRYYYNQYHNLVILDSRIPNIEDIYVESIKKAVSKSVNNLNSNPDTMQKLVKSTFINKIKAYNRKNNKWGEQKILPKLIEEAKQGSHEAKNKLIERYMYIIDRYIENIEFNDSYTEEDIRQSGYLLLTEKINNYFDKRRTTPLSVYISVAFDQIYPNLLRGEKDSVEEYCEKIILTGLNIKKDIFEEENIEFEYCDFIDNTISDENIREIFKYIIDSPEIRISEEQGISRQAINKKVHNNKEKIKSFFNTY